MAEYLTRDVKMAISKTIEGLGTGQTATPTYNAMIIDNTADKYQGFVTTGRNFYIPNKEKFDDLGKVGTGQEFPTQQRSGYLDIPSLEISDEIDIDVAPILLRRCLGGTDAPLEVVADEAYSHTFKPKPVSEGRQLPSSTLVWSLGGADYIWGGAVVESFRVEQGRSGTPTYTATLLSSGKHVKNSDLATGTGVGKRLGSSSVNPFTYVKQRYMVGAESSCKFTLPDATVVWLANGDFDAAANNVQRLLTFGMTFANNHRTDDRRAGDPRIDIAQPRSGHFVNRLLHGDRTITADMSVMLDDTLSEALLAYNDALLTNFEFTVRGLFMKERTAGTGPELATEGTVQSSITFRFEQCYFRAVEGRDDGGDAVIGLTIFPVIDATNLSSSVLTVIVVNNSIAPIV